MVEMKAGAEVDSFCTNCGMVLAHTVIAVWGDKIKRVRCNTCMREHAYRPPPGARATRGPSAAKKSASSRKTGSSKSASEKGAAPDYEALMAAKDRGQSRRYSPKERFSAEDLIDHPKFGLGVVVATRGIDKLDCVFPSGQKTLVHGKGSPPG